MSDERFDKLETKIDKMDDKLDRIDKNMAVNNVLLDNHIKRTELAEQQIEILKQQIIPVTEHVAMITSFPDKIKNLIYFISKILTIISTLVALGWWMKK